MDNDFEFSANIVVRVKGLDKLQRILLVNPQTNALAHIDISGKGARCNVSSLSTWMNLRDAGEIVWADDPYTELPFQHNITAAMEKRKQDAWYAIQPLVSEISILNRSQFFRLVAKRASELGLHKHSVRNWVIEYWQKGMSPVALYGTRNKAGGKGKTRVASEVLTQSESEESKTTSKRGAPRTVVPGKGINISNTHRRIITLALKRFYHKNRQTSLREAYYKMLRYFFQDAVTVDEKGKVKICAPDDIITYRQFRYWARKQSDVVTDTIARRGNIFYEKTMRPLLGNVTDDALGPGYRFQIDATIADVYVVSSINRRSIIGRPVVYVVIDVWSRLIVGMYVGLENPSWPVAMMALHNATLDKVQWCKSFDIDIEPHEWPTAGLASTILGDRGEMLSKHADHLVNVLGVYVENTPPYRADCKSIVERVFGTLQEKFAGAIPAYVPKDYMPRLDNDHRMDATLTLREFTQILIQCVLDHNSSTISGYPLTPAITNDGVASVPTELWAWGLKNRMGAMVKHSPEKLLFGLLPTDEASVTASGILYHGRLYKSTEPHIKAWFGTARIKGRSKVMVSYYPHNLDTLLVHDTTIHGQFSIVYLASEESTVFELCIEEVLLQKTAAAKNNGSRAMSVLEKKMTRQKAIEDITQHAIAQREALGLDNRSKAEAVSNIRENRRIEKAKIRIRQNIPTTNSGSLVPTVDPTESKGNVNSPPKSYSRPQISDLLDD